MYVKEDIISTNRKLTYARQGDYCTIVSIRGHVFICQLDNGSRFTCLENQLTENKPINKPIKLQDNVERTTKHKRKG
jgi:hypothetical protein